MAVASRLQFTSTHPLTVPAAQKERCAMVTQPQLYEYLAEIREQVCSHCIDRPPEGPPCSPRGKLCGIELHLQEIVELAHATHSRTIDPYIERFHEDICAHCASRDTHHCPCPLDPLLLLAIEAIDTVDERHGYGELLALPTFDEWKS
jgi:hypothetical protein